MVQNVSFKYTKDGVSVGNVHGLYGDYLYPCLVWECEPFG